MTEFTYKGRNFTYELEPDYDMQPPWVENDGHGIVVQRRGLDKGPHEILLHNERDDCWFYNTKASTALAKRDCWGLREKAEVELLDLINDRLTKAGQPPRTELTQGEITAEAVRHDAGYCRQYLSGLVTWQSLKVVMAGTGKERYLGGMLVDESGGQASKDDAAYVLETANELANEMLRELAEEEAASDLAMSGL